MRGQRKGANHHELNAVSVECGQQISEVGVHSRAPGATPDTLT
jgi:hypothetical protein